MARPDPLLTVEDLKVEFWTRRGTVYAVNGTAPALVTGNERPISNIVRETFTIAG